MLKDETLFNRMKTSGSIQFVNALRQSLEASEASKLGQIVASFQSTCPRSTWHEVLHLLNRLQEDSSADNLSLYVESKDLERILALCEKRIGIECKARETLSTLGFNLWQEVGHLQSATLRPKIRDWLSRSGANEIGVGQLCKKLVSWDGLINIVRKAQQRENSGGFNPLAETWEEVLLYMLPVRHATMEECAGFGACAFCWRFVPLENATGQHRLECHLHEYNTKEYDFVRTLSKNCNDGSIQTLRDEARRICGMNRAFFRVTMDLWPGIDMNIESVANSVADVPLYKNMDLIHCYFPHIVDFVEQHSGDSANPLSLLDTLDPPAPGESEIVQRKRNALHCVLARDLALYREELWFAELWLTTYKELFGHIKRRNRNRVKN